MTALHLDLLRTMLLIRRFEERCADLCSAGRVRDFPRLRVGPAAVAAAVCAELHPEDSVVSTYGSPGHALARGVPVTAVMAEVLGRVTGSNRGRGGPGHVVDRTHRFLGCGTVAGGGLSLALGLALGDALQQRPGVTACFVDGGSTAEAELREVMDLAASWRLPLLLCSEDRGVESGPRGGSHRGAAPSVDAADVLAVDAAAQHALTDIRERPGPVLLELQTRRLRADPLDLLAERMKAADMIDDAGIATVDIAVTALVERALVEGERGGEESLDELGRFVHSEASSIRRGEDVLR